MTFARELYKRVSKRSRRRAEEREQAAQDWELAKGFVKREPPDPV